MKHINALNTMARFAAAMKQVGISPAVMSMLRTEWQRAARRAQRLMRYEHRMRNWSGVGKRQHGRGGVNHPSILLPRRPRNERDFTHPRWIC